MTLDKKHQRVRGIGAFREAVVMGLAAIRAYKMRAGLTILGVVMGITTVTGMSSIVAGLNRNMASQIEGLGSSVLFVRPWGPGENVSSEERRKRKGLNEREVRALQERAHLIAHIAPMELIAVTEIKSGNLKVQDAQTLGVDEAYEIVHDAYVERGRFISASDVSRGARVAVIGIDVAETLFPHVEAVDKELLVDGQRHRVIGVLERKGKFLGQNRDNVLLLPLGSTGKRDANFNFMIADMKPVSADRLEDAVEQVREILRRERKLRFMAKDTFTIFTQDTLTNLYRQLTGGIYLVMIAISSIGLVVGGVGVMNIMLVSVTERTREIGIRMAIGAKGRHVLLQFLFEAITLSIVGGLTGVLLGIGAAVLIGKAAGWPIVVSPSSIIIAFLVAGSVGVFFGFYPARKASRLDPIDALRYE
jgi:putative ABC transport system permease protein